MLPIKPLKFVAIAVVGALGSALLMQTLQTDPATDGIAQGPEPMRPAHAEGDDLVSGALVAPPRRPAAAPEPDLFATALDLADPSAAADAPLLRFDAAPVRSDAGACAQTLTLSPGPAATVELSLASECHAGAPVRITHDALSFSERLDDDGALEMSFPALAADARVTVTLPTGETLRADARITDIADHARTALVWEGAEAFALHAYHDGAAHGERAHRHAEAPFDASTPGAFIVALGDPALDGAARAEVHSHPRDTAQPVRFAIEARQTPDSCGRELAARVVIDGGAAGSRIEDLSVQMQDCDAPRGAFALMPIPQAVRVASGD